MEERENIVRAVRFEKPERIPMMIYGLYPGVPLKNVSALMDAMDKYASYYS